MISRSLPLAACVMAFAPLAGCTVAADLGKYTTDLGCDLEMDFRGFSAHAPTPSFTGHNLELFVVPRLDDADAGVRTRTGIVVLDPTPAINFDLVLPNAVPNHASSVDFFADTDSNGLYDPLTPTGSRADHAWTVEHVCANPPVTFTHSFNFIDFPASVGIGEDLVIQLSGFLANGKRIETLVQNEDPQLMRQRTVAFHYLGAATSDDPTITMEQALDRGVDYTVEVWIDRNGNGTVEDTNDASDEGYVFDLAPGSTLPAAGPVTLTPGAASSTEHSGAVHVVVQP